jgi:hypothetical protein
MITHQIRAHATILPHRDQTPNKLTVPFGEIPWPSASPETIASAPCETGAPAATFAYLARRACSMNARRTAFMRVW